MEKSSKSKQYGHIKDNIERELYFKILPKHLYLILVHFRSANHRLSIETGRWNNFELEDQKCNLSDMNTIGDKFHCLLECSFFTDERKHFCAQNFITDQI